MVAVDRDRVRIDRRHHHVERAALGLRLQPRPDLRLGRGIEHAARQALHQAGVALAEALLGRDLDLEPVAGLLPGQRLLEPAHDAAGAVQVDQRIVAMGGGDLPAVLAEQGEMDGGDAPVGDFHEWPVVSWRMSAWSLSGESGRNPGPAAGRAEEHTSEPPSLMRNSYDVFCLKTKKNTTLEHNTHRL